jgi:hypothetical protein
MRAIGRGRDLSLANRVMGLAGIPARIRSSQVSPPHTGAEEVIDESVQEFLHIGIERRYPGKWKEIFPGASAIDADGHGILVIHDREHGHLAFASWVLGGVAFSPDLVRSLGKLNNGTVLGAYVLSEGQTDHWSITYAIKMRYSWVDPQSRVSAYMILDALTAVPQLVARGIEALSPQFGGSLLGASDSETWLLMDKF